MNANWQPSTVEDHLLHAYLDNHPGQLFLEVRVGGSEHSHHARRIDGVLVPGDKTVALPPHKYSRIQLRDAVDGAPVHIIEAKRRLNRSVIGQLLAGQTLFNRKFGATAARLVALCGAGEQDLEWVCEERGIEVAIHPVHTGEQDAAQAPEDKHRSQRRDIRNEPDAARRGAFLKGWHDATNGKLYETVTSKKTHANMGNLLGWIYGEAPRDFRIATWERYRDQMHKPPSSV